MLISFTYCPFPSEDEAKDVIKKLLSEKIIACGNIIPAQSHYIWNEKTLCENEWVVVFKTALDKKVALLQRLEELHSYDIPCILQWNVIANDAYGKWVVEQLN